MAQPPYIVDALEIVGDSGVGTRLIESHDTDGTLLFTDSKVTDLALYTPSGMQQVGGAFDDGVDGGSSPDSAVVVEFLPLDDRETGSDRKGRDEGQAALAEHAAIADDARVAQAGDLLRRRPARHE